MLILEYKISMPEIKNVIKELILVPENTFKVIRRDIKELVDTLF